MAELDCPRCYSDRSVISHIVEGDVYIWICLPCDFAFAELWPGDVKRTDRSREHAQRYNASRRTP